MRKVRGHSNPYDAIPVLSTIRDILSLNDVDAERLILAQCSMHELSQTQIEQ